MEWKAIALHVLAGLLGLMFLMAGGTKIMGDAMHVANYANWGYPLWFMTVTGLIEVCAALLMVVPSTRFYGAAVLVAVMFGATATHLMNAEWAAVPVTLILGGLAFVVAYPNRPEALGGTTETAPA